MVNGFKLLAFSPGLVARQFRTDELGIVYDRRFGRGRGRIVSREQADRFFRNYVTLFAKQQRRAKLAAWLFLLWIPFAAWLALVIGKLTSFHVAAIVFWPLPFAMLALNLPLFRTRRRFDREVANQPELPVLPRRTQIEHGIRLSRRKQAVGLTLAAVVVLIEASGRFGESAWFAELLGLGEHAKLYHAIFTLGIVLLGAVYLSIIFVRRWGARRR